MIATHVELALRDNVTVKFGLVVNIVDLPYVTSMCKDYIPSDDVGVRKTLCMFLTNEVESGRIVDSYIVEMLSADNGNVIWHKSRSLD